MRDRVHGLEPLVFLSTPYLLRRVHYYHYTQPLHQHLLDMLQPAPTTSTRLIYPCTANGQCSHFSAYRLLSLTPTIAHSLHYHPLAHKIRCSCRDKHSNLAQAHESHTSHCEPTDNCRGEEDFVRNETSVIVLHVP